MNINDLLEKVRGTLSKINVDIQPNEILEVRKLNVKKRKLSHFISLFKIKIKKRRNTKEQEDKEDAVGSGMWLTWK